LSEYKKPQVERHLANLAEEIQKLLAKAPSPGVRRETLATEEPGRGVPPPWEGGGWVRGEARRGAVRSGDALSLEVATPPLLDIGRLPTSGPLLVGREAELARLDRAWKDPGTHVLTFVAFGGVGKSALVSRWLDRMAAAGWRGARRV